MSLIRFSSKNLEADVAQSVEENVFHYEARIEILYSRGRQGGRLSKNENSSLTG